MPAASTDKLKKVARRWVGQIGAAGVADSSTATIPLASVTNLPTDTAVVATIDRVDANGVATPNLEETVIGVVSGTNLATTTRGVEGTAQAHNAGAVVEILVTAKGYNDIVDWGLVEHSQDGTHASTIVKTTSTQTLTNKTLTSPVVNVGSDAQGDVYYRNGSGVFTRLAPGTSGHFLKTQGAGANPTWAAATPATTAIARAYLNAAQNNLADATFTKVLLDAESYDPGSNFASNKFTAPTTGYYLCTGVVSYVNLVASKRYVAALYKNGSLHSAVHGFNNAETTEMGVLVSDIISLSATDFIELYARSDSGTATVDLLTGSNYTYLSVSLITT